MKISKQSIFHNNNRAFTRKRKLPFQILVLLLLRKGMKSIQVSLNEFFNKVDDYTVTASGYSRARLKLSYKVFPYLNTEVILNHFYEDNDYHKYLGHRLLAIDGSMINLPTNDKIIEEFGSMPKRNHHGDYGDCTQAMASVMYDILNDVVIESELGHMRSYEGDLALKHLKKCRKSDLVLFDRGYNSYKTMAFCHLNGIEFVIRGRTNSFKKVGETFREKFVGSQIIEVECPKQKSNLDLPKFLPLRLVSFLLSTGELEVLITSLIDESEYPTQIFPELYFKRWGIETYFDIIKNRLSLENFTGKSPEAIRQDFYSTILISNLETVFTLDANRHLKTKSENNKYSRKVNKSVSFNILKNRVFNLFIEEGENLDRVLEKMDQLFSLTPNVIRNGRKFERKKNESRANNYLRYTKKIPF